jgi:hypothetical protein
MESDEPGGAGDEYVHVLVILVLWKIALRKAAKKKSTTKARRHKEEFCGNMRWMMDVHRMFPLLSSSSLGPWWLAASWRTTGQPKLLARQKGV